MKPLPEKFLWGGATADFQYEGGFGEGGRGILSHDYETDGSMGAAKGAGIGCGIYKSGEEAFASLKKLAVIEPDEKAPTLTFNTIARHQSRIVRTRIASNKSPWLALTQVGEVYNVPISHGEGRFLADEATIRALAANGQIATQYVDLNDQATADVHFNPNGSLFAVEGITSPDGRVFGKMGHAERIGSNLYKNVPGNYDLRMFEAAVRYFR